MPTGDRGRLTGATFVALIAALLITACEGGESSTVVLGGLSQPRGIAIDERTICVAEAGSIPREAPSVGDEGQVEAATGHVRCSEDGDDFVAVVSDLPFVYYPDAAVTSGAADVLLDGDRTYVLVGEAYGRDARSVVWLTEGGPEPVADLLAFARGRTSADGGTLRSNPWSMVVDPLENGFLVADAATGEVLRVGLDGRVELYSAVPGHEVLTGMAWGPDGLLYVASFGQLPHAPGTGAVVAVSADGSSRTVVDGLTMAIDVGFDADGGLFVLEYASPDGRPTGIDAYTDETGRLLHIPDLADTSDPRVLVDDLDRPTALAVRPDEVYISISAGELAPGQGSLRRYEVERLLGDS